MRYYCTFFDRNYLAKALALLRSLEKHESEAYRVYIVCLDELTRVLLEKMHLPNIELIPLHEVEARDEALGKARRTRELIEYYWTLTPSVIYKVMDSRPEIDVLTYLDADLFFYSSPAPIYREFGEASILIHEHRFSPSLKTLEGNGKYNVGLLCFRRDRQGMKALKWWRDRCNEWCFWRVEDGKMGDQKYLDDWTSRFEGVHVLQHVGAGLAPWNHDQYAFGGTPEAGTVNGKDILFYHFHALAFASHLLIIPSKHAHYPVTEDVLRCCYLPYLHGLSNAISDIREVYPSFDFGITGQIPEEVVFIAKKRAWPKIDSALPGHAHLDLDGEWRCYWLPNGRQALRLSKDIVTTRCESPTPGSRSETGSTMRWTPGPDDYMSGDADMLCEMWPEGRTVGSSDDLLKELSGRPITEDIRVLYIVGAHLFQERALISRLFPNLENIYLFEPLDGARRELEKVAQTDGRLQVFKYAITDADGPIDFHVTDNNGESSSILPMGKHREIFPWVHDTGLVRVEGRTIGTVVREHRLRQPDMLFLDVQGAEYRILSAIPDEILSGTKLVYSEVSKEEIYKGSRPLSDIIRLLSPRFLFAGYAPLMRISPTHGNALFVNRKNAERLAQPLKPVRRPAGAIARNVGEETQSARGEIPLVTAIVSTYNSEVFIAECLKDLTEQTISDRLEIIVVDAASPQNERGIVEAFQKKHHNISYVRTGERIGVYSAWNLALRMAKGKYITPFSTNDRLRRDAHEILARALDDHPEVMLVYGDSYITNTPHETFERHTRCGIFQWPEYSFDTLLNNCMVGPHPMWRRSVHDAIGNFDEHYVALGDQDFFIRVGEKFQLLHIPVVTGLYWRSPDGLSNRMELSLPEETEIRAIYRERHNRRIATRQGPACKGASCGREEPGASTRGKAVSERTQDTGDPAFRARALKKEKRYVEAIDSFRQARSGGDLSVLADIGDCLAQEGRFEEAGSAYEEAIAANPRDPRALTGLGVLLLVKGCPRQAAERFAAVLDMDGREATALCGMGLARKAEGAADDAIGWFVKSLDADPVNVTALHELTKAAYELGRFSEAEDCIRGYLMYRPVDSNFLFSLAGVLYKTGKRGEALDILERLAVVDADHNGAAELRSRIEEAAGGAGSDTPSVGHRKETGSPSGSGSDRPVRGNDEGTDRFAVSIIIPVFNKVEFTRRCLDALARNTPSRISIETIIVDNASTDGTREFLRGVSKDVVVARNDRNLGFAKACNQGARVSRGRDVVFLNNDTVPQPGWLQALLGAAKEEDAAICGARLVYPDGRIQHAGVAFNEKGIGYHIFKGFPKDHPAVTKRRRFQAVTAACMLVRRNLFDELGGFDEGYRNGFEDVDFCLRAREKGCRTLYVPESVVVHYEETTEGRKTHDRENMERFLARWQGKMDPDDDRIYAEEGFRKVAGPDGTSVTIEPVAGQTGAGDPASRGRALKKEKRYVEAIEAFRQARSGGDLSVLADIGDCFAQEGKLDEAGSAYLEAIGKNPRDPRALAGMGVLDLVHGNSGRASERFMAVLETDDRDATALCGMGLARKAEGDSNGAFGWFRRSLDADPVNVTALHELVKGAHESGRLEEAERYLLAYLQYNPSDPHILFSLSGVLYKAGKLEGALDTLERLRLFSPTYGGAEELEERIKTEGAGVRSSA